MMFEEKLVTIPAFVLDGTEVLAFDILLVRGEGNYSHVILKDGRKFLSCRTLKYLRMYWSLVDLSDRLSRP